MYIRDIIQQIKPAATYVICIVKGKIKFPRPDEDGRPTSRHIFQEVKIGCSGSGFVVDPNGYIATNGHVLFSFTHPNVKDDLYIRQLLLEKTADESDVPPEYLLEHGEVESAVRSVYVQLGVSASGFDVVDKIIRGRVIGNPSPASEKDMGIIKIDREGLQSVMLGDSKRTHVGDRIYVIGYPGVVKDHPYLSDETGLEPTVTAGIISAKRKTKDGSSCLQTDADITHGNSGGPAINEKGEVIGIATFGSIGRAGEVHGFNFLRPSELVEEFLEETGVRNVKVLRVFNEISDQIKGVPLLISALGRHGKYKVDNCAYNVEGYCRLWRWGEKPSEGEFIKDGEIYRIKTSPEYCGFCNSFKKKGARSPAEKLDALLRFIRSHGNWKKSNCAHNDEGFCTYWSWETAPTFYDADGAKIKTRKNPEGRYNVEANTLNCATCPSFKKQAPTP